MSNPVDTIAESIQETSKDFRFPLTIGSRIRGEEKFTFIKVKEILPASVSREPRIVGTIVLPMPTNLVDDYKVEYADAELGPIGATAVGIGSRIASDYSLENVGKSLKSGLNSMNSSLIGQVIAKKAVSMIPGISSGNAKATAGQIVTSATNRAVNPYITGVFKGTGFKTYNFTFKLYPMQSEESDAMKDIINYIKQSMLPKDEVIEGTGIDITVGGLQEFSYEQKTGLQTLPHRFDIDFYSGNNELEGSKYLVRIRNASITSFSVDYQTEGNPAFFKNTSAPISSTLNMTFSESKIYTRNVDEDLYGT